MVEDHSDNKRGNPVLPLHGLLFLINSKGSFIYTIPHSTHHCFYYTRCEALAMMGNSSMDPIFFLNHQYIYIYLMTHSTHIIYGYMASDIW